LETTVDHSLKRAERLRQSVLKRAFEGHLVPQDANDEPASVLLERIRAERAKIQPVRRIRRTKAGTQMALREVST
jgi:type I restriction enzyme S subunit